MNLDDLLFQTMEEELQEKDEYVSCRVEKNVRGSLFSNISNQKIYEGLLNSHNKRNGFGVEYYDLETGKLIDNFY